MVTPHVVVVPYPAQGHVIPMLELSQRLVKHGVEVTFVNTHFNHRRVFGSDVLNMVAIPDGLEDWEDRNDLGKLTEAMLRVMSAELEALITQLNPKVSCVVADWTIPWTIALAQRIGLKVAVFCPTAAATLALCISIPELVRDGIIDDNGRALKKQMIHLSPTIPPIHSTDILWVRFGDEASDKATFSMLANDNHSIKSADWFLCNSSNGLESGHFWPKDSACLKWMDQHPPNSVIYVAFGSFTMLDTTQFQELALGLELSGRPFLWVVRQDMTAGIGEPYPRVGGRGRVTRWAPQLEVLSHPSVACFVSHCGWNSTIEGVTNGVPFLCWPYFAEQFANQNYICDEWKVGLELSKDDNGIVTRGEVKEKIQLLMGDAGYKERILNLREKVITDSVRGGSSHSNFINFIDWVKNGA